MSDSPKDWFVERHEAAGCSIGFAIEARLASVRSDWQQIDIYKTTHWGNLMVIDGCIMLTSRDNFIYHEMLVHPALLTHSNPSRVLIIGGGDCGTLREVLKHSEVETVTQVEIDRSVTELSERYFPELCESNNDPRANLEFGDGVEWVKSAENGSLDVIIIDSTDPVGPAEGLFGPAFIEDCYRVLASDGILIQQSESPLIHQHIIKPLRSTMKTAGFSDIRTLPFPQPCYPSGWWSATMGLKCGSAEDFRSISGLPNDINTKYYNKGVHTGALEPSRFML